MTLDGGLVFDLYRDGSAISDVRVHSARPLTLVNVVRGRKASEGLAMLGMMYRICGVAQRYAGLTAWRQATATEAPAPLRQAQRLLLKLETLREHLWQALVMWPELLGTPPQPGDDLRLLSTMMGEVEQALFDRGQGLSPDARLAIDAVRLERLLQQLRVMVEQQVCAMATAQWQEIRSLKQLSGWAERHHTPAARLIRHLLEQDWQHVGHDGIGAENTLPLPSGDELEPMFESAARDEFIARPTWQGACRETNAYTRQAEHMLVSAVAEAHGRGLLARVAARLVELVSLLETATDEAAQLGGLAAAPQSVLRGVVESGQGLAMVEAARGRLIHWLKLQQGVIADYAIVAPTEWNFHPHGVAVQGLKTLVAEDERQLQQQAALWINAIDPCVRYELRIRPN